MRDPVLSGEELERRLGEAFPEAFNPTSGLSVEAIWYGGARMRLGYKDGTGALQFAESAALTLGVTYALKYAVNETRPNGDSQSFPSGHASISFSAAEFMRKRYGWEYGLPAYAAASFVAYSRVEAGDHHPQDVAAGAAIGIISSYIFTRPFAGWLIQPDVNPRYYAIRLSRTW